MMEGVGSIKDKYLMDLQGDFQLLSELLLMQITHTKTILEDEFSEEIMFQIQRNEKLIDSLDITIKEKVINAIFLFTPRAIVLRKIMAYHDMTISLERVGDLILNVAQFLEKSDFNLEGFEAYRLLLQKMLIHAETMFHNAVYSFNENNNRLAYETIEMDRKVDKIDKKMEKRLVQSFQNQSLETQQLFNIMNINSISYNIERIADNAVDMAEAAIYLIEGKDVRHTVEEADDTNNRDNFIERNEKRV